MDAPTIALDIAPLLDTALALGGYLSTGLKGIALLAFIFGIPRLLMPYRKRSALELITNGIILYVLAVAIKPIGLLAMGDITLNGFAVSLITTMNAFSGSYMSWLVLLPVALFSLIYGFLTPRHSVIATGIVNAVIWLSLPFYFEVAIQSPFLMLILFIVSTALQLISLHESFEENEEEIVSLEEIAPMTAFVDSHQILKSLEPKLDDLPRQWKPDVTKLHGDAQELLSWIQENPEQSDSFRKLNSVTIHMLDKLVHQLIAVNPDTLTSKDKKLISRAITGVGDALNRHSKKISSKALNQLRVDMEVIALRS